MTRDRCGEQRSPTARKDAEGGLFALAKARRSRASSRGPLKVVPVPPPPDPADEWNDAPLYQARRKIYPQRVRGLYRRIKWAVLFVTLGIYYLSRSCAGIAARTRPARRC